HQSQTPWCRFVEEVPVALLAPVRGTAGGLLDSHHLRNVSGSGAANIQLTICSGRKSPRRSGECSSHREFRATSLAPQGSSYNRAGQSLLPSEADRDSGLETFWSREFWKSPDRSSRSCRRH